MVLGIRKYGDAVLETPCENVANFGSKELKALVFDMFETMYANKGVGLAAPQVGDRRCVRTTLADLRHAALPGDRDDLVGIERLLPANPALLCGLGVGAVIGTGRQLLLSLSQ